MWKYLCKHNAYIIYLSLQSIYLRISIWHSRLITYSPFASSNFNDVYRPVCPHTSTHAAELFICKLVFVVWRKMIESIYGWISPFIFENMLFPVCQNLLHCIVCKQWKDHTPPRNRCIFGRPRTPATPIDQTIAFCESFSDGLYRISCSHHQPK